MSGSLSPIEHGTVAGWWKHRRRGIPHSACNDACREAWNQRSRTKRKEKTRDTRYPDHADPQSRGITAEVLT